MREPKYTAEQFKKICMDVMPHIKALEEVLRKAGTTDTTRFYICPDGYLEMEGGFDGWSLHRYSVNDNQLSISYQYNEMLVMPDDTKVHREDDK